MLAIAFYAGYACRDRDVWNDSHNTARTVKSVARTHGGVRVDAQRCNAGGVFRRLSCDDFGADSSNDVAPPVVVTPRELGMHRTNNTRRWEVVWRW